MIRVRGTSWDGFLAAFNALSAAGVEVQPRGARVLAVPYDTDPVLLRSIHDSGSATVSPLPDLPPAEPEMPVELPDPEPDAPSQPARKPRTRKPKE